MHVAVVLLVDLPENYNLICNSYDAFTSFKCLVHLSLEDVLNYSKGYAPESVSPKCSEVNRLFTQTTLRYTHFASPIENTLASVRFSRISSGVRTT